MVEMLAESSNDVTTRFSLVVKDRAPQKRDAIGYIADEPGISISGGDNVRNALARRRSSVVIDGKVYMKTSDTSIPGNYRAWGRCRRVSYELMD